MLCLICPAIRQSITRKRRLENRYITTKSVSIMSYQPLRRSKQTNVEINEIKYTPQHRPPERSPTLSSKNKSGILWRKLKSPCINAFRYLDERLAEHFPGWKRGAIIFIILAVISTVINLGLTIWAVSTHKTSPEGLGILYHGDCHRATWWSRFAHALINILSAVRDYGHLKY